jgi:adenine-specific DNA-methyltransferase
MESSVLKRAEKCRLERQIELDSRFTNSERNRLGQFATPPELALDILRVAAKIFPKSEEVTFLDPGLGTGAFFSAFLRVFSRNRINKAVGIELDTEVASTAKELWCDFGLDVRTEDFTRSSEFRQPKIGFNLIICNPPYVRHHHLSSQEKARLRRLAARVTSIDPGGLAGLYCYFMLLSHAWMDTGGLGLWLVPSEFLDVNYGDSLRRYLTEKVALIRIHRFSPEDVQFSEALVTSCVVVFQKRTPDEQGQVSLTEGQSLLKPGTSKGVALADLRGSRKWGAMIYSSRFRKRSSREEVDLARLGEFFEIRRGIATGANDFFILERRRALEELHLPGAYLKPILPSPRHLPDLTIQSDSAGWPKVSRQLALLNCNLPRYRIRESYPELDGYLSKGEEAGLNSRYLLKGRNPWYRQETRPPAPILCTYMGRPNGENGPFRFFRNLSTAIATNVYLMLYPKSWLWTGDNDAHHMIDWLFELLIKVPSETLIKEGRSYGGGLRKVEPRELAAVPLNIEPRDLERLQPSNQLTLF